MSTQLKTLQVASSVSAEAGRQWTTKLLLIAALIVTDLIAMLIGFWLAYNLRFEAGFTVFFQHEIPPHDFYQQFVFLLAPIWVIVFALFGLYDLKRLFAGTREYSQVVNATTMNIMLVILFTFVDPTLEIARAWVVLSWILVAACVGIGRFAFRRIIHRLRSKGQLMTKVLIIGANEEGKAIAQQLQSSPNSGIKIVGFADNYQMDVEPHTGLSILGSADSILSLIQKHAIQEVVIASTALSRDQFLKLVQILHSADVPIRLSSGLYELLTTGVEVYDVGNVPLLTINKVRLTGIDVVLKRTLDLIGATLGLLFFLPVMVVIGIAVKMDSPGPVFYRRRVVGVGGKQFDAFKFRTMCTDADAMLIKNAALRQEFEQNYKLKDDPRITRVGQFIRATSLDELPQFINVLLGQMSLVGPRMITSPERVNYGKWSMNLFTVKPGITGLWQVSGRSDVTYDERVRLDMQYIRNYSIWMDIYLLLMTIPAVLKQRGAY